MIEDRVSVPAWDHGVTGDGSDQSAALQAIIDGLPAEGGTIVLKGSVRITSLNLSGRRHLRLVGIGAMGSGSEQRTYLYSDVPLARVIDARDTMGLSFERLFIDQRNAGFVGAMIDFGVKAAGGAALYSIRKCTVTNRAASALGTALDLFGSTQGTFEEVNFCGAGTHVRGQNSAGVNHANLMTFRGCAFNPGRNYPVLYPADGWKFDGCNFQAGTDGIGRAVRGSLNARFRALTFDGCTFYDVTGPGGIWVDVYWGEGFNFRGNLVGGADPALGGNYGVSMGQGGGGSQEPGVRGFDISGNAFRFMTAGIQFAGNVAADTHAKKGMIGGNSVFGSTSQLIGGVANMRDTILLPNFIHGLPEAYGARLAVTDLPIAVDQAGAAAIGLQTGTLYRTAAGDLRVVF